MELTEYKLSPGASYDGLHGAPSGKTDHNGKKISVYDIVLNKLINEQGCICAYCMKRIPEKHGKPSATIEHIKPQSQCEKDGDFASMLDYKNMLAVCSGNRNASSVEDKTCDARRGNFYLYLNPLIEKTISSIQYKSDGTIFSNVYEIDIELNKVLNLNCETSQLKECRKQALDTVINYIKNKYPSGDIQTVLKRMLEKYSASNPKTPYVGIIIFWLRKHIHKI